MKCFIGLPADPSVVPFILDAQKKALELDAGARPVPAENFHLTLAFIGEIQRDAALEAASLLPLTSDFTGRFWAIDRSGLFRRPQAAWVGGPDSPELKLLSRECREILDKLNVPYDRSAFKAHVTILRKSRLFDPVIEHSFLWPILRPRLFESTLDAQGRRVYLPL